MANSYLYTFNYNDHHYELCKLESRQLFNKQVEQKCLISNQKIDPNISPFIKSRLDIITSAIEYKEFLQLITDQHIQLHGFTVDYLILDGDTLAKEDRRKKQKDVGYCIQGGPDFVNPRITYAICNHRNMWHFGVLTKENNDWHKHNNKPYSFSNSIGLVIAKTLVSIAAKGNKEYKLLDACCGVGTVILEACIAGFKIHGCDINVKAYYNAVRNIEHYKYSANIYHKDIKEHNQKYDAAIIDLPYNLYSKSTDGIAQNIIESTSKLATRLIIVSIAEIEPMIVKAGLKIIDFGIVIKRGKSTLTRKIWVTEKS